MGKNRFGKGAIQRKRKYGKKGNRDNENFRKMEIAKKGILENRKLENQKWEYQEKSRIIKIAKEGK